MCCCELFILFVFMPTKDVYALKWLSLDLSDIFDNEIVPSTDSVLVLSATQFIELNIGLLSAFECTYGLSSKSGFI